MILLFSLIMGVFLAIAHVYSSLPVYNDYYSYYIASQLLRNNQPLYGVGEYFRTIVEKNNYQFVWGTGYSYPPLLAQIITPLSFLTFPYSAFIWTTLQIVLYCLFIQKITAHLHLRKVEYILPLLLFFGPAFGTIIAGQVNILVLWCIYFYLYSKNDFVRAFGLCIAGWIKVFPFVLVIKDVLQRKWRFIFVSIPIGLGLLLFQSIPMAGINMKEYFFQVLPHLQTQFDPYITNQSIVGVFSRFQGNQFNTHLVSIIEYSLLITMAAVTVRFASLKSEAIDLLWIMTILLVAGKNSYWNMLPSLFVYLFLYKNSMCLSKLSKMLLAISTLLNVLTPVTFILHLMNPHLIDSFGGKILSSFGFIALICLYYPLILLILRQLHTSHILKS